MSYKRIISVLALVALVTVQASPAAFIATGDFRSTAIASGDSDDGDDDDGDDGDDDEDDNDDGGGSNPGPIDPCRGDVLYAQDTSPRHFGRNYFVYVTPGSDNNTAVLFDRSGNSPIVVHQNSDNHTITWPQTHVVPVYQGEILTFKLAAGSDGYGKGYVSFDYLDTNGAFVQKVTFNDASSTRMFAMPGPMGEDALAHPYFAKETDFVIPANGSIRFNQGEKAQEYAEMVMKNRQDGQGNCPVTQNPDVTIEKRGPVSVMRGENFTYELTAHNIGQGTAQNVVITDTLPQGISFNQILSTTGCSANGQTVTCTIGTLAAGAQTSVKVGVIAPGSSTQNCSQITVTNTASVSTSSNDTNSGNNQATATTHITCAPVLNPDIQIIKSGPTSVVRGQSFSYTLTATNIGQGTAQNVLIRDPLPNGVTFVSASNNCSLTSTTVECGIGTLNQNETRTFTVTVTTPAQSQCVTTSVSNRAIVITSSNDQNQNNNESTVSTQITCPVAQTGCIDILKEGFDENNNELSTLPIFTFKLDGNQTVQTNNQGRATFSNVSVGAHTVTETSLANWELFNITPANGVVNVAASTNCAAIAFKNRRLPVNADLQIVKSGPTSAVRGTNLQYTLIVKNNGPATAQNVVVGDPLPTGTTFVPTQSDNRCTLQGTSVFCALGAMTSQQQISLQITVATAAVTQTCATGTVTNQAAVQSDTQDPNLANNQSSFTTQLTCPNPDLSIVKSGPASVTRGTNFTYTLTVTNIGQGPATSATVSDTLPTGVTFVSAANNECTHVNGVVTCPIATLAAGASKTFTLTVTTPTIAQNCQNVTVNNTATVTVSNDTNQSNNQSTAVTQVTCPTVDTADMLIQKSGPVTAVRGQNLQYALIVKNNGPSTAQSVIVTDALPTGTTYVSAQSDNRCTVSGNTVTCALGAMTANQQISLQITVSTLAATTPCQNGTVTNTASVSTVTTDPVSANNQASFQTTLTCPDVPDVQIVKSGPTQAQRGTNFTYTLTVTNVGQGTSQNVVITDVVPSTLNVVSTSNDCSISGQTVTCTAGTLTANQSKTFSITVNAPVQSGTCSQTSVTNTATVASTNDTNSGNNQSSSTTQITCQEVTFGCIEIVKETFDTLGNVLTPVTQFTFSLDSSRQTTNASNGRARFDNVPLGSHTVTETIPSGWNQQSVTPSGGVVNVTAGTCATVTFKNKQNTLASNDGFTITKTDHETEAEPGDTLTYEITVKNVGLTRRTNITVTDTLPRDVEFIDANPSEDDEDGREITWDDLTFEPGETKTFEVEIEIDDDFDGTLVNVAEVEGEEATDRTDVEEEDDNDDDNDDNGDVEIDLVKMASTSEVFPGGIIDYTVTIENTGNDTIKDLTVADTLPADVIIVDDGDADEKNGRKLEWMIDELEEGDTVTFRYRVSVPTYMVAGQSIRNDVRVTDEDDEIDERAHVIVIVIGDVLPQTGGRNARGGSHLSPIASQNGGSSAAGAMSMIITLALTGIGAGMGVGRKMLIGF